MNAWYEEWFNTDEYLNVYRHRNESEAKKHVDFILGNFGILPPSSVLDMACGPGRHSLIFAEKGYRVTAVDLSDRLLCTAKKTADELGLKINFIKSDLRDILIDGCFDLIINLFTSFGYFDRDEENYRIFDVALKHLNYNGKFVIDFFNKNFLVRNLQDQSEETINNIKIIQSRKISDNRVIKKIKVLSDGSIKNYYESVRLFSPDELICAMNDRGLFVDRIYGDFNGGKFDPELSERIIIFAVK